MGGVSQTPAPYYYTVQFLTERQKYHKESLLQNKCGTMETNGVIASINLKTYYQNSFEWASACSSAEYSIGYLFRLLQGKDQPGHELSIFYHQNCRKILSVQFEKKIVKEGDLVYFSDTQPNVIQIIYLKQNLLDKIYSICRTLPIKLKCLGNRLFDILSKICGGILGIFFVKKAAKYSFWLLGLCLMGVPIIGALCTFISNLL